MKICPVCNDTFADQLNFCDVDGTRLTQSGSGPERNKLWSLVGAGLLIGALVISAASIFFLPRSRVPAPIVSSEPTPAPVSPKPPVVASESTASAATPAPSGEPESPSTESLAPELKRKEKAYSNSNSSGALPNPKAAAIASEEGDKKPASVEPATPLTTTPKKPEQPAIKGAGESHPLDATVKPSTPSPDPKKDPKAQAASSNHDKDSKDKKKEEEKKKGGFLKVFKKIFGKD